MQTKKPDWAKIRAEYIAGGIGQRKLARKYNVSENTLIKRANAEGWANQRGGTYNEVTTKVQQKTADEIASNAVKMERARGLAIDRVIRALERMPEDAGSRTRQTTRDAKGRGITRDYDLLALVSALEKLNRSAPDAGENVTLEKAREILGGVHSAID